MLLERIQSQLRASAAATYEAVAVPPFTCFVNPDDANPGYNYAIPDEPVDGDPGQPLDDLAALYRSRVRSPRFEFLEAYAPGLSTALAERGYRLEMRSYLMTCTPADLISLPPIPNVSVRALTDASPLSDFQALMTVQSRSFGAADAPPAAATDAENFRRRFAASTFFVAEVEGEIVSAGAYTPHSDSVTEVVGIATLPGYRGRGIAGLLTSLITRHTFGQGVDLAFLTAGDEAAGRVYGRVGFQPAGYGCSWILESTA
jgi:GNAT superfamily N-acetyltransferase